jgi:integrase
MASGAQAYATRSKYAHLLLEDQGFNAWYRNVMRGSANTGSAYLRRLGRLCDELYRVTPHQLVSMNKTELTTFASNVISDLEETGMKGDAIKSYIKAIKSWAEFNDKKIEKKLNIEEGDGVYEYEVVPQPKETQSVLDHSDARAKVAGGLVAFSGLRTASLGTALGTDGLKVKDLPEMEVKEGKVSFMKVPALVLVRKKISKTREAYVTFAPSQLCESIRVYLEDRLRQGESITGESAVITVSPYNSRTETSGDCGFKKPSGEHITTTNIRDMIRKTIREAGFGWRPYILRRYFDTRMLLAEADGQIIRDWRTFWMGHSGDIEFDYTLKKGLPDELIEKMRAAFLRAANRHLCSSTSSTEEDLATKIRKQLLLTVHTADEVAQLHLEEMSDDQVMALLRKRLLEVAQNQGMKQKFVSPSDVPAWSEKGWVWKGNLGDGSAVMEPAT